MKRTLKDKLIVLVSILTGTAVVLVAQQGTAILKNYNSNTQAQVGSNHALYVNAFASDGSSIAAVTDPCAGVLGTTVPVSITTDTVVITALSGKKNYICGGELIAAAAEVVSIDEGTTGGTCGSGTVALVGSTTDANGISLAANGGFIIARTIFGSGTNVDTCIHVNSTNRVAGHITYVQN